MKNKNISEFLINDYNLESLKLVKPLGHNFDMYVATRFIQPYSLGYEKFCKAK